MLFEAVGQHHLFDGAALLRNLQLAVAIGAFEGDMQLGEQLMLGCILEAQLFRENQRATGQQRLALLGRIRQSLLPGGALILSEKLRFSDPEEHGLLTDLHVAFKRANGYSELEIAQKRSAIENVMKPDSLEEHRERLLAAGFSNVVPWFQCLNFASLIALP